MWRAGSHIRGAGWGRGKYKWPGWKAVQGKKGSGDGEVLRDEHEGMVTEVTEPGEMVEAQGRGCLVRGAG